MATKSKATAAVPATQGESEARIARPRFSKTTFQIVGTHPYVQNRFGGPGRDAMRAKQMAGSTSNTKRGKRDAKDPDALFLGCQHISTEGWVGIPSASFRCALISACRLVGYKMTLAKLSVFCEADGFSLEDSTPLVKITKGKPKLVEHSVRNATGVADLRYRPMWMPGWEARPTLRWDADQFTLNDVANLLARVGMQVGLGEGRPDSKSSSGMDWGMFRVEDAK